MCDGLIAHSSVFFFKDTATTEIYTLSLHDALPILQALAVAHLEPRSALGVARYPTSAGERHPGHRRRLDGQGHQRSEEHTSELQSRQYLVCRLLLEKKNSISMHISS